MTPQEIQAKIDNLQRAQWLAILQYGIAAVKAAISTAGGKLGVLDGASIFATYAGFVNSYGNASLDIDNLQAQLAAASASPPARTIANQPTVTFGPFTRPGKPSTLPAPIPVQSQGVNMDGIFENGVSFTITGGPKGDSIMVIDAPIIGTGTNNGLNFNGPQAY